MNGRLKDIGTLTERLPQPQKTEDNQKIKYIPSGQVVNFLVDADIDLTGKGLRIAVIDTGMSNKSHQWRHSLPERDKVMGFTANDWHGHGTHIGTLIGGSPIDSEYGVLSGMAPDVELISIKAYNYAGLSNTLRLLEAMELAIEYDCDIINISSGGKQNDRVDNLLENQLMSQNSDRFWVCAAGNSGHEWGISTPALCPDSIAVGSVSMTDSEVSDFSAIGPQGRWYEINQEEYNEDLEVYGDLLIKPDVVAPGGGRAERGNRPMELITSSMRGWFDGFYDADYDGIGSAQGTSQAAPFVSGLIALLLEGNVISTPADFKNILASQREKRTDIGWGIPFFSRFLI